MIDPKRRLFKWGPIDGKILYTDSFMDHMVLFQKEFPYSWPDTLDFISNDKILIILDYEDLYSVGERMFRELILEEKKKKELYHEWIHYCSRIEKLLKRTTPGFLKCLADEGLTKELQAFNAIYDKFWSYGFVPEIANWGGERILHNKIKEAYPDAFNEILEILSTPEELSFYQREELDLLRIKLKKNKSKYIKGHQQSYFWIKNSYGGVLVTPEKDFRKRLDEVSSAEAKKKVFDILHYTQSVKRKKQEAIRKHHIAKDAQTIGSNLSFTIWWQDLRKKYIFMALHIITLFAFEVCRRNKVPERDVLFYNPGELFNLAAHHEKAQHMAQRKRGYASYYSEKKNAVTYLYGEKALAFMKPYTSLKIDTSIKEFSGHGVSKGKARGHVCILTGARHFGKLREGDVLVASMTSPEFVVAMRKAAAIVTDEGGYTSHAAIVSREMKKPCIVGTRIATRVLKDGDYVEVDADKGIVRKVR